MTSVFQSFAGKKVLVTGHTGFKGSWLTQLLLRCGADVIGYALPPSTKPALFSALKLKSRISNHFADIRDRERLIDVVQTERPELVLHLAAQPLVRDSYASPHLTFETNVMGTVNVLEAIRESSSVKSAVIVTTDKVYKNREWEWPYRENDELGGHDPYSASKAAAEIVVESYIKSFFSPGLDGAAKGTLVATARSGNVIGGGDWSKDRLIPDIVRSIYEQDRELVIRNPTAIRPWQHVLEPLVGYLYLAGELYNGSTACSSACNFAPSNKSFITVEEMVKRSIARLKKGSYRVEATDDLHEAGILTLDATKAATLLGWYPALPLDTTLDWTFDWYKAYYQDGDVGRTTDEQIGSIMKEYSD